ncbi:MAG: HTH domain-containing protein [Euryarchaeota archaeon]|nr:HTH domain-containing protein [Euryarchaeota archaeon]
MKNKYISAKELSDNIGISETAIEKNIAKLKKKGLLRLTSVLFFGITCPLAELGYNPEHIQQLQVNLALLVSKHDKCPISHFIYNGSRNSLSTIKNLIAQLLARMLYIRTQIFRQLIRIYRRYARRDA